MAILRFTLTPDSVSKFYDALVCLGKFSETVIFEATRNHLSITALNSSKSAYASFNFKGSKFFTKYQFTPVLGGGRSGDKFTCKVHNKALLLVFKGRGVDPTREKDTAIEKCEVSIEDGEGKAKSRLIIRMFCRHGVLKTYRLTFEAAPAQHALFRKQEAKNHWSISSRTLRDFVEHFGPKTELLDIYSHDGKASFTSYTEKVMSGNEVLKQPLHTSIAIDTLEFTEFVVEEKLHLVSSVKDFKSIVTHAGPMNTVLSAFYSGPGLPLKLEYNDETMNCEFILMTIGDSRGSSTTPAPGVSRSASERLAARIPLEASSRRNESARNGSMAPPSIRPGISRETSRAKIVRPSPPPPSSALDNSMFVPMGTDDAQWDPVDYDAYDNDMPRWDATIDHDASANEFQHRLGDIRQPSQSINGRIISENMQSTQRIAPTQRESQVRGIFDDMDD